jgi:uncharacterized protein YjbJ (UPF0337 family)
MKLSTRFQARGMFRIARGTVKGFAAKITSNRSLGTSGKFDKVTGRIQCRIGKVQGAFGF